MRKSKTWQVKGKPIWLPLQQRIGTCTLYGAISSYGPPVYYTAESTNTRDFNKFLEKVIKEYRLDSCADEQMKPYIVYDNHTAHRATVNEAYIELYFNKLRLPIYSCEFNSIETLWAHIKRLYKHAIF